MHPTVRRDEMSARQEVEKGLVGLKGARTKAGLTQEALADRIGTDRANIAGFESAARTLKFRMAEKISEHIDVGPAELVIANRLAAMKRAKKERDPAGVILAAKGILEIAGDKNLTSEGEAFLEAVADEALEFVGKSSASHVVNPEQYGLEPALSKGAGRTSFVYHASPI
jgi:transcriptional regulator with XRE-family HTH domain